VRETLFGRHAVYEALRAGRRRLYRLLLADSVHEVDIVREILALAAAKSLPVERVPRRNLDWLGEINHQGVVLEASDYLYVPLADLLAAAEGESAPPLLLLIDLVQDPQNLGSLLRSADAAGAHGVIIQHRRAAGVTPAVVHASAGAAEHVRVAQVTNLAETIEALKGRGIWVVGLEHVRGARLYTEADLTVALGLVVGSEGEGLRRLVRERCDYLIELPMLGRVNSLNAAVAGAVVLYEARRQRAAQAASAHVA